MIARAFVPLFDVGRTYRPATVSRSSSFKARICQFADRPMLRLLGLGHITERTAACRPSHKCDIRIVIVLLLIRGPMLNGYFFFVLLAVVGSHFESLQQNDPNHDAFEPLVWKRSRVASLPDNLLV
jgi:hypothetical protein